MSSYGEEHHSLLCEPPRVYSGATVRRAFIVWMYCGHHNNFNDVCQYFHQLEVMEEKLPESQRLKSRHHELNLFSNKPPTSSYLNSIFPKLYKEPDVGSQIKAKIQELKETPKHDIPTQGGTSTKEILEASQMIRKYCKSNMMSIHKFLAEFQEYTAKCDMRNTVNNVASFIRMKMIQAELDLENNYPKSMDFLHSPVEEKKVTGPSFITMIDQIHFSNTRLLKMDAMPKTI